MKKNYFLTLIIYILLKKIAIIMDIKIDSGGALGMCLTKINYIKNIGIQNFNIITTYKSTSDFLF